MKTLHLLPEENDGAVKCVSEVEGGVGVALAGSTLSEVADDDAAVLGSLERIGTSHSYKGQVSVLVNFLFVILVHFTCLKVHIATVKWISCCRMLHHNVRANTRRRDMKLIMAGVS